MHTYRHTHTKTTLIKLMEFARCEIHTNNTLFFGVNFQFSLHFTHTLFCTHTQELLHRKESLVSPERVERMSTCNWGRGGQRKRAEEWERKKDWHTGGPASGHEKKSRLNDRTRFAFTRSSHNEVDFQWVCACVCGVKELLSYSQVSL